MKYPLKRWLKTILRTLAHPLILGTLFLEAVAVGLIWMMWELGGAIPLVTPMNYVSPPILMRSAITAFSFGLGLAGIRIMVMALWQRMQTTNPQPTQQSDFAAELQDLLNSEKAEQPVDTFGLRFVAQVLGLATALALLISASLVGLAIWHIAGF